MMKVESGYRLKRSFSSKDLTVLVHVFLKFTFRYQLGIASVTIGLSCFAGCVSTPKPNTQAATISVRHAGQWYSEGKDMRSITKDYVTDASPDRNIYYPSGEPIPFLFVEQNGSLRWPIDQLPAYGEINSVRNTGDRFIDRQDKNTEVQVLWSEYCSRSSQIILGKFPPKKRIGEPSRVFYYRAYLNDDDTLTYWEITPRETCVSILHRISEPPHEEAEHLSEGSPFFIPFRKINNVVIEQSSTGTLDLLVRPLQPDDTIPLIVIMHASTQGDGPEQQAKKWASRSERFQCAFLIPKLLTNDRLKRPTIQERLGDVQHVFDCVAHAKKEAGVGRQYLLSEMYGGMIGHLIWQSNNQDFSAFLAFRSRFTNWNVDASETIEKNKPVFLWTFQSGQVCEDENRCAYDWYTKQGYANVHIINSCENDVMDTILTTLLAE